MCLAGAAECQAPPANKNLYVRDGVSPDLPCHCRSHQPELERSVWRPLRREQSNKHTSTALLLSNDVFLADRLTDGLLSKKLFLARKRLRGSAADLSEFSAGAPWWRRSRTGWMGWWQSGRKSARQSDSPDVGGRSPKTSQAARANARVSRKTHNHGESFFTEIVSP